ncbi:P-loop containing nucleoside triphosphate hydrolase protein [Lipomyces oligophaga]|uniref:P-loop containing nucleoside triphosphate hydrolase protein n=1 Tax=Lipomyces oligophaga TaxID=45792 RepID=UPI0034CD82AE
MVEAVRPSKRRRPGNDSHKVADDQTTSYVDRDNESNTVTKKLRTDYAGQEFDSLEEDVDSEDEAFNRTQMFTQPETAQPESIGAESGVILSVELKNFMCHDRLKVEFGPSINFIIGHNGSGKSAILTGITICLGAKANTTQRASSIKSLVKEGKTRASVIVVLKNGGVNGYRQDVYGNSISIERQFGVGTVNSSYVFRSEFGVKISEKKDELHDILDFFGIVVDNPMAILSQDTARSFLSSSTDKEKYEMFMTGVRLEALRSDYDKIYTDIMQTRDDFALKSKDLEELKAAAKEAELLYNRSQNKLRLEKKMNYIEAQFAWAHFNEQQEIVDRTMNEIEVTREESKMADEQINQSRELYESRSSELVELSTQYEEQEREENQIESQLQELRNVNKVTKTKIVEAKRDETALKAEMDRINKFKEATQLRIEQEMERLKQSDGGRHAQLEEDRKRMESTLQELKAEKRSIEDDRVKTQEKLDELISLIRKRKAELDRKAGELNENKIRVDRLQTAQDLSVFGPNINGILADIQNENRFTRKPVGPLGRHIALSKPEWSGVLEAILNQTTTAFAITCYEDERLLHQILRRHNAKNTIITRKYDLFDYQHAMPDSAFTTVLHALEIDDEYVKRVLIDMHQIERTILIKNREEAENVMYNRPPNVKCCLALAQSNRGNGFRILTRNGSSSIQPQPAFRDAPRMKTDTRMQLRNLQTEASKLEIELDEAKSNLTSVKEEWEQTKAELNDFGARIAVPETKIHDVQRQLYEINSQIQSEDDRDRLSTLQTSLQEAEMSQERLQSNYQAVIVEKDKREQDLISTTRTLTSIRNQRLEYENKLLELNMKKESLEKELRSLQREVEYRKAQSARRREVVMKLESSLEEQSRILDEILQMCKVYSSSRVNTDGKTSEQLAKEVTETQEEIAKASRELPMSLDKIPQFYIDTQRRRDKAQNELNRLSSLCEASSHSYSHRVDRYFNFRSTICSRAKAIFKQTLAARGFQGKLIFDHDAETLTIQVQPSDNLVKKHNEERSVKTLSGGEKSFTQICLLMALWDAMNCPIRGLDEFDVYMDAVNRNTSLQLMIQTASRSVDTQTIFITPQAMGNSLGWGENTKIIRMSDPERSNH